MPFNPKVAIAAAISLCCWFFSACNQTDTGISKPIPDCYDGIQNQGELGVDCGGPCPDCPASVTALVDGSFYQSQGPVNTSINNNSILFLSGNGTSSLSFIYTGNFVTGTFPLQSAVYTITATNTNYISTQGTISFTEWDAGSQQVSGTFKFTAIESSGSGDTIQVKQGHFLSVPYQP